jgi:hypothetical protein
MKAAFHPGARLSVICGFKSTLITARGFETAGPALLKGAGYLCED